jgi:hypothetical protein
MSKPWLTIIGGGLAGLSLCDELLSLFHTTQRPLPGRIVIIERRAQCSNNQTFSFFAKQAPVGLPYRQFSHWSFSEQGSRHALVKAGKHFSYYQLAGADVFQQLLDRIGHHPQVELQLGVDADDYQFASEQVIDTRPCDASAMQVKQRFVGVEVEFPYLLDLNTAKLMTNMRMLDGCFTFDYVIPLSPRKALVEITQFAVAPASFQVLSEHLQQTLQSLGVTSVATRGEQATLPMGVKHPSVERLASQQIRTASGYGYLETKAWAQQSATALSQQRPINYSPQAPHQRWFDGRLLRVIEQQPEQLPRIFMRLASRLSADNFARFMSQPTVTTLLKVIAAVPKRPFLRTLYD